MNLQPAGYWPRAWNGPKRRKLPISSRVITSLFVLMDTIAILSSAIVSYLSVVGYQLSTVSYYAAAICFVWLVSLLLLHLGSLYKFEFLLAPFDVVDKFATAFLATFLFLLAAAFSLKISSTFSRTWIASFAIGACTLAFVLRLLASRVLIKLSAMHVFTRDVVVAGGGAQMDDLLAYIRTKSPRFMSIVGVFVDDARDTTSHAENFSILGGLDELASFARSHAVDDVIIALPWSEPDRLARIVGRLRELPLNVFLATDLVGFKLGLRSPPSHYEDLPIVEVAGKPLSGWDAIVKAAEDYCLGAVALLALAPLMAIIAAAIKIDSNGPVLFWQRRLGVMNRVFYICKFRTMRHEPEPADKTPQATRDDPRVTRVGRLLRRTSLDELPQLFNVLNGAMSLVGPRPHALDHNKAFAERIGDYFVRHRIKPGMTGWAQVNGLRGETTALEEIEARVRYDIYYAENWSLLFDLRILAMTAVICLTGRNAY